MAKVHSLITLNKSSDSKCKFCITKSWKNSNMNFPNHLKCLNCPNTNCPKEKLAQCKYCVNLSNVNLKQVLVQNV